MLCTKFESSRAPRGRDEEERLLAIGGVGMIGDAASWVRVARRPYGVVACIVPWNAPVILTAQKVAPALVAGNAVVVKPSPFAPLAVSVLLERIAGGPRRQLLYQG